MAQLLKRTKKSCLKVLRKISSSKHLIAKKLEEEEDDEDLPPSNIITLHNNEISPPIRHRDKEYDSSDYTRKDVTNLIEQGRNKTQVNNAVHDSCFKTNIELDELPSKDIASRATFQSLTAKLFYTTDDFDFNHLNYLPSDSDTEESFGSDPNVVFEKVRYKRHVRYLRHTPSLCSLVNEPLTYDPEEFEQTPEPDINSNFRQYSLKAPNRTRQPRNYTSTQQEALSAGDKCYQQRVVISDKFDTFNIIMPLVKWDINENALEEGFYINDNWDSFDNGIKKTNNNYIAEVTSDDSVKSSFRSSSTTLETWVEDEALSFSEHTLSTKYQYAI